MKNVYFMRIGMTDPEGSAFEFQTPPDEARAFIRRLLQYTVDNRRTRAYTFSGSGVVAENVVSYAKAMLDPLALTSGTDLEMSAKAIADTLLKAERHANARLEAMGTKIPTGSLVLALIRDEDDVPCFIIAKVDHTKFFEGSNLTEQTGFSGEDRDIWKTAVVRIAEAPEISVGDILVYMDRPAKYWTEGFLSLVEQRTDSMNSKLMYKAVLEVLKKVESISANDFLLLWATLARRMRSGGELHFDAFAEELFDGYVPQNPRLDSKSLSALKKQMLALPEKRGFDRNFTVDPSDMVSMLRKQTIEVADGIELTISEKVADPSEWISSFEEPDGTRYLKIRCEESEAFKKFR